MERSYSQGSVEKHNGFWRAVLSWQDENGKQRRVTKSTGVRCYPDKPGTDTKNPSPTTAERRRRKRSCATGATAL